MAEGIDINLIHFEPMVFPEQTIPNGALPADMGAQACWYYYVIAQKAKEEVGDSIDDQIILEGLPWLDTHYGNQKHSVAIIYGVSMEHMDKFWNHVEIEAGILRLPEPDGRYMRAKPRLM